MLKRLRKLAQQDNPVDVKEAGAHVIERPFAHLNGNRSKPDNPEEPVHQNGEATKTPEKRKTPTRVFNLQN